ncbi:MAG: hypothetical protein U0835_26415 [Isosphaeraceae bacterium]
MDLNDLKSPAPRSRVVDSMLLWGAGAVTLGAFAWVEELWRGRSEWRDGVGFGVGFLVMGHFLLWLPRIFQASDRTWLAAWITPLFITLVSAYMFFAFRAAFIQPTAAAISVVVQLVAFVVVTMRSL